MMTEDSASTLSGELTERLRSRAWEDRQHRKLREQAADRIDQLEAALAERTGERDHAIWIRDDISRMTAEEHARAEKSEAALAEAQKTADVYKRLLEMPIDGAMHTLLRRVEQAEAENARLRAALRGLQAWIEEDEGFTFERIVEIDDGSVSKKGVHAWNERFISAVRAARAALQQRGQGEQG